MALIPCKSCTKKISSKALICPKCGYDYEAADQQRRVQQVFLIFALIVYLLMWVIQFAFTLIVTLFVFGVLLCLKRNFIQSWLNQYIEDHQKVEKVFYGSLIGLLVLIFGLCMYFYVYQPWLIQNQKTQQSHTKTVKNPYSYEPIRYSPPTTPTHHSSSSVPKPTNTSEPTEKKVEKDDKVIQEIQVKQALKPDLKNNKQEIRNTFEKIERLRKEWNHHYSSYGIPKSGDFEAATAYGKIISKMHKLRSEANRSGDVSDGSLALYAYYVGLVSRTPNNYSTITPQINNERKIILNYLNQ